MTIQKFSPHIFWYCKKNADLSPRQIIRQVIAYGEIADLLLLSKSFLRSEIQEVTEKWQDRERYEKRLNFLQKVILES